MYTIALIIAAVLVIAGIYSILARGAVLWGIVLIILGLIIGPGGYSILN